MEKKTDVPIKGNQKEEKMKSNTLTFQINGHLIMAIFTENRNELISKQVKQILLSTAVDNNILS